MISGLYTLSVYVFYFLRSCCPLHHLLLRRITHAWCSFTHLYGPQKSSNDNNANIVEKWDDSSPNSISTKAACAKHTQCKDLGLTGDCCPSQEGIMLGCCE